MDRDDLLRRVDDALGRDDLDAVLGLAVRALSAETGTIHLLGDDGALHLAACDAAIPEPVRATIRTIPVGKGMAGLAVERAEPVTTCNLQTDGTGDVRPGAKATGMQGAVCVPILDGDRPVGALGVAQRAQRTFAEEEERLLLEVGRAIGRGRGVARG